MGSYITYRSSRGLNGRCQRTSRCVCVCACASVSLGFFLLTPAAPTTLWTMLSLSRLMTHVRTPARAARQAALGLRASEMRRRPSGSRLFFHHPPHPARIPGEFIKGGGPHGVCCSCWCICGVCLLGSRWPVERGGRWMKRAGERWSTAGPGHGGRHSQASIRRQHTTRSCMHTA